MADCKIAKCICAHEGQDQLYSKGKRLFNPIGKGKDQGTDYRCTVCGRSLKTGAMKSTKK